MGSTPALAEQLSQAQQELRRDEAIVRRERRLSAGGLAVSGVLLGVGEVVPNHYVKAIVDAAAVAIAGLAIAGPGLDSLQMRFDVVSEDRREVAHLTKQIAQQPDLPS